MLEVILIDVFKEPFLCCLQVVIIGNDPHQGSSHDIGGFGLAEYYTEDDDDRGGKRGKGKKGRKKGKGKKKILKKLRPVLIGLGGMKLLLYHMLMKKMAIATFFSFLLSKVSFILATLVALKQFFHTPVQHRSADSNKLEVVHIPIRKLRTHKDRDKDYDESKFIPVRATYPPELAFDTTPFYHDFPDFHGNNPEAYNDSEEHLSGGTFDDGIYKEGNFNHEDEKLNGMYNEHFNDGLDKSDSYDEKTFYKNHVHSPFV